MKAQTEINTSTIRNPNSALPEGWRWVRLGEVCEVIMGQSPPGYTYNKEGKGLPFYQGKIEFGNTYLMPAAIWCTEPKKIAESNDILISVRAPVGPSNLCKERCCIGRGLAALRPKKDVVSWFVFYYLRFIEEEISGLGQGSTFSAISKSQISNLEVLLPPLLEQTRIAAKIQELMEEMERARSACEKQLEAAKALPTAYLHQTFESEEAKKWERKKLGEVCEYDTGIWGEESDSSEECYYVLRSNNIQNSKIVLNEIAVRKVSPTKAQSKKMQIEDILVTTSSGSRNLIGKCALFDIQDGKNYLFSNFTMRLKPKLSTIVPGFLFYYLLSPIAKYFLTQIQATTSGLRNLDRKKYVMQNIPLPPLPVQQHIALELKEKMTQVEKLRLSVEKQLEAINALPQAILRKAFRGEL